MTLTYYGHCAFLWTSPNGARVLIDPFRNSPRHDWFVRRFPPVAADVALVTHDHFDHDAVEELPGQPAVVRGPGTFDYGDIVVRGVRDIHSANPGREGMTNTIFVIESEAVRYCHIGDNRHDIPPGVRDDLREIDVLMVTVDDSSHLLSYDQVEDLTDRLTPRVVVPMHYYIQGLSTESSTLLPPDRWLAGQPKVRQLGPGSIQIARNDLPQEREVWVFGAPATN